METFVYILFIIAGMFSVLASVKNWNWYFNNFRVQRLVRIFGRTGTRIVYTFIGVFMLGVGIVCLIRI